MEDDHSFIRGLAGPRPWSGKLFGAPKVVPNNYVTATKAQPRCRLPQQNSQRRARQQHNRGPPQQQIK